METKQTSEVVKIPALIGHGRVTGFTTVQPRGDFEKPAPRDCEIDGANQFLARVA
jgi:hypothetical protein